MQRAVGSVLCMVVYVYQKLDDEVAACRLMRPVPEVPEDVIARYTEVRMRYSLVTSLRARTDQRFFRQPSETSFERRIGAR
jgi:hypothetical protein